MTFDLVGAKARTPLATNSPMISSVIRKGNPFTHIRPVSHVLSLIVCDKHTSSVYPCPINWYVPWLTEASFCAGLIGLAEVLT